MRVVVKALMVSPVHWPPFKTPEAGTLLKPQRDKPARESFFSNHQQVYLGNTLRSSACKSAAADSELQNFFFHTHLESV
jgi:hypothetical protein